MATGCAKTEGEGGAATIKGKVMVQDYTTSHTPNGSPYPGYDVKVYIIYGNGTTYHDDCDCSYDGTYEFRNLRKGTYKVFVYTDIVPEPSDPPKQDVVIQQINITDKKGVYTVPDIDIKQY
jgi:hypothetical protein